MHTPEPTVRLFIGDHYYILRGTFILDAMNKPTLITPTNKDMVKPGDPILRKLPGLVVNNIFHTVEEYRKAAREAGWEVEKDTTASFADEQARSEYNATHDTKEQLGPEYVGHPPFLVLKLRKPTAKK